MAVFVVVTYGGTWLLLLPTVLGGDPRANPLLLVGYLLGAFVPSATGVALAWWHGGRKAVRALVGRLGRWRVGVRWYGIAVGVPIGLKLAVLGVLIVAGYARPSIPDLSVWPTVLALAIVGGLVPGAIGEELGWRGFALPLLQARYSAVTASLLLGVVWALWHLPTFFVPITGQASLPMGWLLVEIVGVSVLYTWIVNSTRGSVLLAIVFHAANNSLTPVLYPGIIAAGYAEAFAVGSAIVVWLAAGVVVLAFGTRSLAGDVPATTPDW